jgi:RNA polymerase-binding transcription factor
MKKIRSAGPKSPNSGYQQMLLDKKERVMAGLGIKFDTIAKMGRVAEEDQAQMSHDEFVSLHLNSLDYVQLRLIEEALDRIDSGDYGVCLACEEAIPPKRLLALPWARYCVTCQEEVGVLQERHILDDRPRLNFA